MKHDSPAVLDSARIAYFSMEIALNAALPTYSGGLGVLAGDTIFAAADLGVPMVGVTLLHRRGYFRQTLDAEGWQHEEPVAWDVRQHAEELPPRIRVELSGRDVRVRAWLYMVNGCRDRLVPVLLLDTDLAENHPDDRGLTDRLYIGDRLTRLKQEVVLGVGGLRILRALGMTALQRFHLNEGHATLLAAELLREHLLSHGKHEVDEEAIRTVRDKCIFTTHTPVESGHDRFTREQVRAVIEEQGALERSGLFEHEGMLNLTYTGLNLSRYVNGVAKRHGEVSQHMFASYRIDAITNGVHAATWTGPHMARVFDVHIPDWREDSFELRYAAGISRQAIDAAHRQAKHDLLDHVHRESASKWNPDVLTLGFARRATAYKRPGLLFHDLDRLEQIARRAGGLQLLFAGKAHPEDLAGKHLIQDIIRLSRRLPEHLRLVYLPDYDTELARRMVSGVDVWLNTPRPPLEASGTSGMKAALNGVPSLSTLDGWWIEGCIEGVTGWAIGEDCRRTEPVGDDSNDALALYNKLETAVVPLFLNDQDGFLEVRRQCIALNGSFFNTHRMLQQYVTRAYL